MIGVYGGLVDKFPIGTIMNRSLTIKSGQCHVHRYMRPLLERIQNGEIDPTMVITHRMPLADAAKGYDIFLNKEDGCEKVGTERVAVGVAHGRVQSRVIRGRVLAPS